MSIFTADAPATSENTVLEVSPKRLTQEQAKALFHLTKEFRPDWTDDWKTFMGRLQDTVLYTGLDGHQIISLIIKAAATEPSRKFEDLPFLGVNPRLDAIDEEDED